MKFKIPPPKNQQLTNLAVLFKMALTITFESTTIIMVLENDVDFRPTSFYSSLRQSDQYPLE